MTDEWCVDNTLGAQRSSISLATFKEQIEKEPQKKAEKELVGGKPVECAVIKTNREKFQKEKGIDLPSLKNHLLIRAGTRMAQVRSLCEF